MSHPRSNMSYVLAEAVLSSGLCCLVVTRHGVLVCQPHPPYLQGMIKSATDLNIAPLVYEKLWVSS